MLEVERAHAVASRSVLADQQVSALLILENAADVDTTFRSLQSVYAAGLAEVARQVGCHCSERGQLLVNLCASSQLLNDRYIEMKVRSATTPVEARV